MNENSTNNSDYDNLDSDCSLTDHLLNIDSALEVSSAELMQADDSNAGGIGFAGASGTISSDVFGNLHAGDSPFPIGHADTHGASGTISSDVFGNLHAGDSPFPIGHADTHGASGTISSDVFGNLHAGDSPFPIE